MMEDLLSISELQLDRRSPELLGAVMKYVRHNSYRSRPQCSRGPVLDLSESMLQVANTRGITRISILHRARPTAILFGCMKVSEVSSHAAERWMAELAMAWVIPASEESHIVLKS